jgi:feruloyl esterase
LAGFPRGSETGRTGYFVGPPQPSWQEFCRLWAFNFPGWDWRTFNFDRDLSYADKMTAVVNALNTKLAPFEALSGKLVMSRMSRSGSSAENGVRYYGAVQKTMGGAAKSIGFLPPVYGPGNGPLHRRSRPNTYYDAV